MALTEVYLEPERGDLAALGEVLWPGAELLTGSTGVRQRGALSEREEHYVVLPSLAKPRYLLPASLGSTGVARLLRSYNGLRPTRTRWARGVLATGARAGWLPGRRRQQLVVQWRSQDRGLRGLVSEELGRRPEDVALACGIRVNRGITRPIVTVMDLSGAPLAFVKVARTAVHQRRLRAEHRLLTTLHRAPVTGVHTPAPLFLREWGDSLALGTAPLPGDVEPVGPDDIDRASQHLDDIAALTPHRSSAFADSAWREELLARVDRLSEPAGSRLRAAVDRVAEQHGDVALDHGIGHGDWSFWNLATTPTSGELCVWDWEFGHLGMPQGLDRLHWTFGVSTTIRGVPAGSAARRQLDRAADGTPEDRARCALHLLEEATRRLEDADLGNRRAAASGRDIVTQLLA